MGATSQPPYQHRPEVVDVAGLGVSIESFQPSDLALLHRVLGQRPAHSVDLTISISPTGPEPPGRVADFEGPYGDHWFQGSSQFFHHHWGLDVAIAADRVEMGGPAEGYRRWVTVRNAMLFVLAHAFRYRDAFLLHAAAIHREDHGVLILGESGSGKSTLAFGASLAGWDVLADDMVVARKSVGHLTVQGVPRVPSVPGEIIEYSVHRGDLVPQDERRRVELTEFELDANERQITDVVITSHAERDGVLDDVTGPEVLESLIEALVLSAVPEALREWFPLAAGLSGLPHTRLLHAPDPETRVGSPTQLLDRWFSARRSAQSDPVAT
ncbi:MAG: hypothetical protein ACK5O2_11275 [Microthrixaceae bacterium]